jgi:SET domain-containing protein
MIHPDTRLEYIDDEIGYGVFATKKIPKGTITWVLDKFDKEFKPAEVAMLEPLYKNLLDRYSYRNEIGNQVLCWDFGRFVNHSFKSNFMSTAYGFEIAIRDIEAGEEVTDDYGYLNLTEPLKGRDENTSRKYAYPDDLLRYHAEWDKLVMDALPLLDLVPQPLEILLSDEVLQELHDVINGKKELRSILEIYYRDPVKVE